MLDVNLIKEFVLLSDVCNYARAAEDLFIAQSTLSKHIMSLEKQLGHPLFSRSTRRVTLTEFGISFLPYAHSLLNAMNIHVIKGHEVIVSYMELPKRINGLAAVVEQVFSVEKSDAIFSMFYFQADDSTSIIARSRKKAVPVNRILAF